MRILIVVLITGLILTLAAGCSDKQKEAEKLEQELRDLEAGDESLAVQPESTTALTAPSPDVVDAGAVPEEEAAVEQPMPEAPAESGYTVQVASCESAEYARYLVKKYQDRGYQPFVSTIEVGGQTYYRVRIGSYGSLADAKAMQAELVDKYSLTPWIDRLK